MVYLIWGFCCQMVGFFVGLNGRSKSGIYQSRSKIRKAEFEAAKMEFGKRNLTVNN
jgi:hypothetical protein